MVEDPREADLGLLTPLYADETVFNGSVGGSAHLLKLLMDRGTDQGYISEPSKYFLITDYPE